jgi:hypothetical protein
VIAVGQHQLTGTIFCPDYLLVAEGHVQVRLQGRRHVVNGFTIWRYQHRAGQSRAGPGFARERTAEQQKSRKAEKQKSRKADKAGRCSLTADLQ